MRRAFLLAGFAVVLGGAVRAAAPRQGVAPQAPVFTDSVNLVRVDVVVTGRGGEPVTDLKPSDFSLSENGRPQEILSFQHVAIPVSHRTVDPTQPPAPSPDVASNAPASRNSRVFVIIIDDQEIIPHDIAHVKQVMTDFLRALSPDDQVAMIFTGRSDLSVNFTNDVGRLLRAVDGVRGAFGLGLDVMGVDATGRESGPPGEEKLLHARTALETVKNATNALAGSGYVRRAIVFVSGYSIIRPPRPGCPTCMGLDVEQKQVYDLAHRAGVPIYTLDPRGYPVSTGSAWRSATVQAVAANARIQQAHLAEIAEHTGGLSLVNQADLTHAVDTIVADNDSFYLLGYSPNPSVHDGRFHPIEVRVNRPGLVVRPRAGYVAEKPADAVVDAPRLLNDAMAQGVDASGLILHATAAPVALSAKGMTAVVVVDVSYPAGDDTNISSFEDSLRLQLLALDPDAGLKASGTKELHLTARRVANRSFTVRIDDVIDLPAQPLTLRIGVASSATARAGTVQLPVEVPNLSNRKLVIGGPLFALAGANAAGVGSDVLGGLVPFQPVTTRTFSVSDTLSVFAPIFWTTKDEAVEVTVSAAGDSRGSPPQTLTLSGSRLTSGRHEAAFDGAVSLKDVPPGPCRVTIVARLPSGPSMTRQIPCTVDSPR